MTLNSFPTSPPPDAPFDTPTNIGVLEAEFGDGYSQRSSPGINNSRKTVALTYTNVTRSERDSIRDFCTAHSHGEAFYFTLPDESTPRKWRLLDFKDTYLSSLYCTFNCNLKEVFDLST
jgi:phage-related protein